jgi:hypothetical protein
MWCWWWCCCCGYGSRRRGALTCWKISKKQAGKRKTFFFRSCFFSLTKTMILRIFGYRSAGEKRASYAENEAGNIEILRNSPLLIELIDG